MQMTSKLVTSHVFQMVGACTNRTKMINLTRPLSYFIFQTIQNLESMLIKYSVSQAISQQIFAMFFILSPKLLRFPGSH